MKIWVHKATPVVNLILEFLQINNSGSKIRFLTDNVRFESDEEDGLVSLNPYLRRTSSPSLY